MQESAALASQDTVQYGCDDLDLNPWAKKVSAAHSIAALTPIRGGRHLITRHTVKATLLTGVGATLMLS